MHILGINCFSHDTAASLIKDGEPVAFVEEERFNKEKHTRQFPDLAIEYCLKEAGISIDQVDYVGFPFKPGLDFARGFVDFLKRFPFAALRFAGQTGFDYRLRRKVADFRKRYRYSGKIVFTGHHEAHMASAFFVSPFENAAILSIDRGGDYLSTVLAKGEGNKIEILRQVRNPDSLGSVYTAVTQYLGFKANSDEGKVMGLAPYGRPTYYQDFQEIARLQDDGSFKIDLSYFTYHTKGGYGVSPKFIKRFGPPREPESGMEERYEDIAWALQKVTEDAAVHLAQHLYELTGLNNLCIAGGVGLNSCMNAAIMKETAFEDVFIQAAANDAGTALGATYYIWNEMLGKERNYIQTEVYLGPTYSNEKIKQTLDEHKISYEVVDAPAVTAAELLAQGKIIGWLQGRMEVGPRALGNRSILADPRPAKMKDILNHKVKHREGFRPFAPSVLEENGSEYFDDYYPTPFMLLVLPIKKEKRDKIPAVVHVDGTGRMQTIQREDNPLYWELINEFKKLTGVPVVLNTSFNVRGQPIVMTPEDALKTFLGTQMDYLIMGNYLIRK